jgi:hypothetical protein
MNKISKYANESFILRTYYTCSCDVHQFTLWTRKIKFLEKESLLSVLDWACGPESEEVSFLHSSNTAHLRKYNSHGPSQQTESPADCNVRHWNDEYLLLIKASQPFSDSHEDAINGFGPAPGAIYTLLIQKSMRRFFSCFYSLLKHLLHLLLT